MIKRAWKDPVWSKVIAAGILTVFASAATYFLGAWPVISSALIQAWEFILGSTLMPRWLLGLMSIPCILLIVAIFTEIKEKLSKKETAKSWKSYKRDNFFELLWSWRYVGNRIDNLHSLCPRCEYQILPKDVAAYAVVPRFEWSCDDCGYSAGSFEGHPQELLQKVELKIQKATRTGEWVNRQNA